MPKDGGFGVSKTLLFVNFLISFMLYFVNFIFALVNSKLDIKSNSIRDILF